MTASPVDRDSSRDKSTSVASTTSPEMFYVCGSLGPQPWLGGHNVLVSAGTAWKNPGTNGAGCGFDIYVPDANELFVDSGGFQALVHFDGSFPYTPSELFIWAEDVGADYVAGMDLPCAPASALADQYDHLDAEDIPSIETRVDRTIELQKQQWKLYSEVQQDATAGGGWSFEFVPVVQGDGPESFRTCASRLKHLGLVGDYAALGTTCKRDDHSRTSRILSACREELPATEFHLFGGNRQLWASPRFGGRFRSTDTHGWSRAYPDREGNFPHSKDEKRESFENYKQDIRSAQTAIADQAAIDTAQTTARDLRRQIAPGVDVQTCRYCGTTVSQYGRSFTPGCQACQQIERRRWGATLARVEAAADNLEEKRRRRGALKGETDQLELIQSADASRSASGERSADLPYETTTTDKNSSKGSSGNETATTRTEQQMLFDYD